MDSFPFQIPFGENPHASKQFRKNRTKKDKALASSTDADARFSVLESECVRRISDGSYSVSGRIRRI